MKYRNKILAYSMLAVLAACAINNIEATTTPIKSKAIFNKMKLLASEQLRDPEATRFKPEYKMYETSSGDIVLCGSLNGKNAMGGYVGYKPFYMRARGGEVVAFNLADGNDKYGFVHATIENICNNAAQGKIMVNS